MCDWNLDTPLWVITRITYEQYLSESGKFRELSIRASWNDIEDN